MVIKIYNQLIFPQNDVAISHAKLSPSLSGTWCPDWEMFKFTITGLFLSLRLFFLFPVEL